MLVYLVPILVFFFTMFFLVKRIEKTIPNDTNLNRYNVIAVLISLLIGFGTAVVLFYVAARQLY